jgi:CubicO group peptidase (beta-lactamase class C family)
LIRADEKINEIESNVRVPVVIKNTPQKYSLLDRMRYYEVPGASVAVIDQGKVAWSKGYGLLEEGKDTAVNTETRFQAASISKSFTALAVMSLVKRGLLNLDSNVNDYLVSWKIPESSFTKDEKVTIRRLLSHTAGLTDRNGFPGYQQGMPLPSLLEILKGKSPKVNSAPIVVGARPGSFFKYSGGGYEILQQLIEDITYLPFEKFVVDNILSPLEMTHSTFEYLLPKDSSSEAAAGHMRTQVVKGSWHLYPEKAAAGLWTTPTDLSKMIISIYNCSQGIAEKGGLTSVLGANLCREMLTIQKCPLPYGGTTERGLGFVMLRENGVKTFSHSGSNEGYLSHFRGTMSKNGLHGTVIMTNSSRGDPLIDELEKTIDDVYGWKSYQPRLMSWKKRLMMFMDGSLISRWKRRLFQ